MSDQDTSTLQHDSQLAEHVQRPRRHPPQPGWRKAAGLAAFVLAASLPLTWYWHSNGGLSVLVKMADMPAQEQAELQKRQQVGNEYLKSKRNWMNAHMSVLMAKLDAFKEENTDPLSGFTVRLQGGNVWEGIATSGLGAGLLLLILVLLRLPAGDRRVLPVALAGIALATGAVVICASWWWRAPAIDVEPFASMGVGAGVYVALAGALASVAAWTAGLLAERKAAVARTAAGAS